MEVDHSFVIHPIRSKLVSEVPGITRSCAALLTKAGYPNAINLLGQALLAEDQSQYKAWFVHITGSHQAATVTYINLKQWIEVNL